jgi:hypothetical protein
MSTVDELTRHLEEIARSPMPPSRSIPEWTGTMSSSAREYGCW